VPVIDALSDSAGLVGEAIPVAALFDEIHSKIEIRLIIK
jgi:hypothetical protein